MRRLTLLFLSALLLCEACASKPISDDAAQSENILLGRQLEQAEKDLNTCVEDLKTCDSACGGK